MFSYWILLIVISIMDLTVVLHSRPSLGFDLICFLDFCWKFGTLKIVLSYVACFWKTFWKTNMYNIGIFSFRNGLNYTLLVQLVSIVRAKLQKIAMTWNMFLTFGPFSQNFRAFLRLWHFFISPSGYPINNIFYGH